MANALPAVMAPEKPLTRGQAQRQLGLFAPHDYCMLGLIIGLWVTLGFWRLFGAPTALELLALAVVNVVLAQLWLIALAYRCLVFILDLHADISLMPEAAARIVLGFREGRAPR
jgi:hypothetical protein